jgi:hypothetical protein
LVVRDVTVTSGTVADALDVWLDRWLLRGIEIDGTLADGRFEIDRLAGALSLESHRRETIEGTFDAAETIGETIDQANAQASAKFGEICVSHDDYIWSTANGSGGPGSIDVATVTAKAGVSVYMVCDMAGESRADELVASFAPVYDAQVEAGSLAGWGWLSHVVGGEYRRLLNMRGVDHNSVMAAWGEIIGELTTNHADAMTEFAQICGSHQDYLWNIR